MSNKKVLTKNAEHYSAPEISVVEMHPEGCLCESHYQTETGNPDDFEYGGLL